MVPTGIEVPPLKLHVFEPGLLTVVKYCVVPASFQICMLAIAAWFVVVTVSAVTGLVPALFTNEKPSSFCPLAPGQTAALVPATPSPRLVVAPAGAVTSRTTSSNQPSTVAVDALPVRPLSPSRIWYVPVWVNWAETSKAATELKPAIWATVASDQTETVLESGRTIVTSAACEFGAAFVQVFLYENDSVTVLPAAIDGVVCV